MSVTELFEKAAPRRADRITIRRPDDFHVHLRDGAMLAAVLPFTAGQHLTVQTPRWPRIW